MKKTLKVKAAHTALVQNYEAMDAGVRRFIGRRLDPSLGECGGWVPKEEGEVIPFRAEYVQAVKDGDLEVMDQESALLCGIKFSQITNK